MSTEVIKLKFIGKPKAVQSFRFTRKGFRYQTKDIVEWKNYIKLSAIQQLGNDFKPFNEPLGVRLSFRFTPPKSWTKKRLKEFQEHTIYKDTKPDLTDNLLKGFVDALAGIVWERDQIICKVESEKIYAEEACILLEVYKL